MSERIGPPEKKDASAKAEFDAEVRDATLLLDFAVSASGSVSDARKLDDALIDAIKFAQDLARMDDIPRAEERAKFERALSVQPAGRAHPLDPVTSSALSLIYLQ